MVLSDGDYELIDYEDDDDEDEDDDDNNVDSGADDVVN